MYIFIKCVIQNSTPVQKSASGNSIITVKSTQFYSTQYFPLSSQLTAALCAHLNAGMNISRTGAFLFLDKAQAILEYVTLTSTKYNVLSKIFNLVYNRSQMFFCNSRGFFSKLVHIHEWGVNSR
jgi:hypothetical protein